MARRMAFSSIMMALAIVCLFGAAVAPSAKISLLALTSVFCAVSTAEYGSKSGLIHYVGVSLLSLLLIPKKMFALVYTIFLGYYPIVKLHIESLNRKWLEWILKVLLFNIVMAAAYIIFRLFFLPRMESAVTALALQYLPLIVLVLEVVFVLYDIILSYIITYYNTEIRTKMNHG